MTKPAAYRPVVGVVWTLIAGLLFVFVNAGVKWLGPTVPAPEAAQGYTEELWSLYLLRAGQGQGLGRALMAAVAGDQPFTALVLAGNGQAAGFYRHCGAKLLGRRDFDENGFAGSEDILAWNPPFAFAAPEHKPTRAAKIRPSSRLPEA